MKYDFRAALSGAAGLLVSGAAAPGQVFQPLPAPAGVGGIAAAGISADGAVISGNGSRPYEYHNMPLGMPVGYRWTAAGGWQPVGIDSQVGTVSADGSTILGLEFLGSANGPGPGRPFYWRPPASPVFLADGEAHGVSADGRVISGFLRNQSGTGGEAYLWSASTGYRLLGHLVPLAHPEAWASGVSADGLTATGTDGDPFDFATYQGFVWTASDGMRPLGTLPGALPGRVFTGAISADGQTIIGNVTLAGGWTQAFMWTRPSGMVGLRILPGFTENSAGAVSADGSVIVGTMSGPGISAAFIWDRARGMRDLKELLVSLGTPGLEGWTLGSASGVSADGSTIVGNGAGPGGGGAFLARIPAFCLANCDGSTVAPVLNVADFTCFLNRFVAGDAYANCDGSTTPPRLNIADFVCFMGKFAAGCP